MSKILIIEARFYDHLADMALAGAADALTEAGMKFDVVTVPGALEIPAALLFAKDDYDAFVVLGCVIRGETSHYDMVCRESFRGVYDLVQNHALCLGNGIQTVDTEEQAAERLDPHELNKGGAAARTALHMLALKKIYEHG